jgi:hypothetical protein
VTGQARIQWPRALVVATVPRGLQESETRAGEPVGCLRLRHPGLLWGLPLLLPASWSLNSSSGKLVDDYKPVHARARPSVGVANSQASCQMIHLGLRSLSTSTTAI